MTDSIKIELPKPPDPNTEEGKKLARLKTAIGTLFLAFSSIEISLFTLIGSLWPVPLPIAKAVYGDMRVEAAINASKRLIEARKQMFGETEVEKGIAHWSEYALTQLAIINGIRNHIAHHGFGDAENYQKGMLTNALRARGAPKEIPTSPEDIEAMNSDLVGIMAMASVIGTIARMPPLIAQNHPVTKEGLDLLRNMTKQLPWRYKSPLQGGSGGKSRKKPQESKPPPQSSPA